ncbi:MAG TPA: hypothetical protein VGC59_00650 [Solirubrobacteraceae bacterium]
MPVIGSSTRSIEVVLIVTARPRTACGADFAEPWPSPAAVILSMPRLAAGLPG